LDGGVQEVKLNIKVTLVSEVFSAIIANSMQRGSIHGAKAGGEGTTVSHLFSPMTVCSFAESLDRNV